MKNRKLYLYIKLSEECSEIIKAVSKLIIFGENEKEIGKLLNNKECVISELNDLATIVDMMQDENIFPNNMAIKNHVKIHTEQVNKYFEYSNNCEDL